MAATTRPAIAVALMLCCASVLAQTAVAPQPDPVALARLDGFAQGLAAAGTFSGVVLVARDGRVLSERAYGKVDEKRDVLAGVDTRYNLASAGKMFTSVAVWQQIAAGRMTLDTTVGAVLDDYPDPDFARRVTVRQLLTHTAGAGDIDLFGAENAGNRERLHSVADMVAAFGHHPPDFEPGEKLDYGNFGYVVLGRMVEVLSHEDYAHYVERHVFAPAGMTRTGFDACTSDAPDIAAGYVVVDGERRSNCLTQPVRGLPAGGQVSTAGDMLRFVVALQSGRLLPAGLFDQAIRPYRQFMGLGFFSTDYTPDHAPRDARWGHGGSSDGACTDVRTYPRTGETVIVLSNQEAPACFQVANFLHRQPAAPPR